MYIEETKPIKGYKCFNKGLTNRYGLLFEIGKTYHAENKINFGTNGNGYHMCRRLEDTLRFFDAMDGTIDICKVCGYGYYDERTDNYNEYSEMYAVEYLHIESLMKRNEIIDYALNLNTFGINRFISLFKLTEEEQYKFYQKFQDNKEVIMYLDYYQKNKKDTFKKRLTRERNNI